MAKNPEDMTQTMIENLPEKTGKSLDQWMALLQRTELAKHGEIVKHLKSERGVTHGFANLIAHKFLGAGQSAGGACDDLVEAQYAGVKAGLRPIYEALVAAIQKFGGDVELAPKKAYVSLRRNKQFGIIQPSTKDRVDIGINLKAEPIQPDDRLEKSGSFNSMVSHRVRVSDKNQIDKKLIAWLKQAYLES